MEDDRDFDDDEFEPVATGGVDSAPCNHAGAAKVVHADLEEHAPERHRQDVRNVEDVRLLGLVGRPARADHDLEED